MDQDNERRRLTKILPSGQLQPQRNTTEVVEIAAILSKLALHYWRPEFSESQAKQLLQDFLQDLERYAVRDIEYACKVYRQNPENKFYPTPGQLLGILGRYETKETGRLEAYRAPQIEMRQATKSVAQVLLEHGFSAHGWKQ